MQGTRRQISTVGQNTAWDNVNDFIPIISLIEAGNFNTI